MSALLSSIAITGFAVAFAHAAIPTHWLPFVLAGRGQRWRGAKTLAVVALCGAGHVLFTTILGALVVWLGIEASKWIGNIFPWLAGGALILIGFYYLAKQWRGGGHGHHHFGAGQGHTHGADDHHHGSEHAHSDPDHRHGGSFDDRRFAEPVGRKGSTTLHHDAEKPKSDAAVIVGLFTLLTFSPCEGFLPIYLSAISFGWPGFVILSTVLALATLAGMMVFTQLTMLGIQRLRLEFLERRESAILGGLMLFLGVGIIFFGF